MIKLLKLHRFCTVFVMISSLTGAYAQGFNGDTWATALKNKSARVVLTNADLAKFSETVDGNGSGICFDIMNDFATYVQAKYGVAITYDYQPVANTANFQSFLNVVKASKGGVFGLGDITITTARKNTFDFAPPYFENVAILVTDRSVPELGSLSDIATTFKGMKAVSQRGTTHDKILKEMQRRYGNFEIVYAETSVGKTDKVLSSPEYWSYIDFPSYLKLFSDRIAIKRHSVGDRKGESFGFIMPKGSDWAPIITEFFNANGGYVNSEDYRAVLNKNLGPKVVKLISLLSRKE
ncbi:MAG: ABC transporter substrate-binding protein [Cytophagales bacterium]|nr:ABC transporter substrate-binding protein [Cytophagales bacterium]